MQYRVVGGDPAIEFRRVATCDSDQQAVELARDYLAQAGAGYIAAVVPGDRLFINQGGSVREVRS